MEERATTHDRKFFLKPVINMYFCSVLNVLLYKQQIIKYILLEIWLFARPGVKIYIYCTTMIII
jgi:hypothetical protein